MMTEGDMERLQESMAHHVEMVREASRQHFKLLVEKYPWLIECEERLERRKAGLMGPALKPLDLVAAAVAAHRADTEARRAYGVRES